MSGNLAFEVRGPLAEGPEVYYAPYRARQDGLGWRTYLVNHVEGGFPQANWTFGSAAGERTRAIASLSRSTPTTFSKMGEP